MHTTKTLDFKFWMKSIDRTSRSQRDKLRERLEGKVGVDPVVTLVEQSLNDEPTCPYCMSAKLYRWGKVCELQRYRCRQCNRTFTSLTNTPLAWLRYKEKWLNYEQTMIQGLSLGKSANSCGIAKNTSFKWRHRFLRIPAIQLSNQMNGIVEADETYFLESLRDNVIYPDPRANEAIKPLREAHQKNRYLC